MKDILNSDELLGLLGKLSNPYRLKIIAIIHQEKRHVCQLARELGISRPLNKQALNKYRKYP